MREIPLKNELVTLVDDSDFEWLSKRKWYVRQDQYSKVYTVVDGMGIKMSRLILGVWRSEYPLVDHIDGDGFNNQRSNLRLATYAQNVQNRRKSTKRAYLSQYKGVSKNKGKWVAYIGNNRKQKSLGSFLTEEEAARAYDEAAKKLFGEFAKTNF